MDSIQWIKNKILNHFNIAERWWYDCDYSINLLGSKINSKQEGISFEEGLIKDHNDSDLMFTPFLLYYFDLVQWIEQEFSIEICDEEMPENFIYLCRLIYRKINNIELKLELDKLFPDHISEILTIDSSEERKNLIADYFKSFLLIDNIVWVDNIENAKQFQFQTIPWGDVYKNENSTLYLYSIQHEDCTESMPDNPGSITFLKGYFE